MVIPQTSTVPVTNSPLREVPGVTSSDQMRLRATEEAFSASVEQSSDLAYNVALRMLRNVGDAQDAFQEAFLSAYRSFSSFKGQSKVTTWLYRILVNACLMKIRKEKIRTSHLALTDYEDVTVPDLRQIPENYAINTELRDTLETGLSRLPSDLRSAVVLRDVQGLSNEEAAAAIGVNIASFKSRLHKGRVLLRKHLEGYMAEPS